MDYGLDLQDLIPGMARFFSSPQWSERLRGPPSLLISPGVKRPGREADHSPTSSAEVKNDGAVPTLPHVPSWRGT
jgi:hypothetical protein